MGRACLCGCTTAANRAIDGRSRPWEYRTQDAAAERVELVLYACKLIPAGIAQDPKAQEHRTQKREAMRYDR